MQGNGAAGVARACAARHERHTMGGADLNDVCDLCGAGGKDDDVSREAAFQRIGAVDAPRLVIGADVCLANNRCELGDQGVQSFP